MVQRGEAIHTYKARRRVTPGQAAALDRLRPRLGADLDAVADPAALFGRTAALVLEIGSGMGEATVAMAAAEPGVDVLAVEVHTPGVGALLRRLEQDGLTNVRVAELDARDVLARLPVACLAEVRVFFPDPWPKARHHKRRLVTADVVAVIAERLRDGGLLHVATDWPDYAEQARTVVDASDALRQVRADRGHRPVTRFERRGLAAGRLPLDLVAIRLPR